MVQRLNNWFPLCAQQGQGPLQYQFPTRPFRSEPTYQSPNQVFASFHAIANKAKEQYFTNNKEQSQHKKENQNNCESPISYERTPLPDIIYVNQLSVCSVLRRLSLSIYYALSTNPTFTHCYRYRKKLI